MSQGGSEEEAALIEGLKAALDSVLTELVAYRLTKFPSGEPLRLRSWPTTGGEMRHYLFDRISVDPFEGALLFTLRGIGEELFRHGGTSFMRRILVEVARLDPPNESRRLSPADTYWNGVGDADDVWLS